MTIQHRTVAPGDAEARLDRWFRRHFPQLSQGALQKLLRTGQVRVDGKRAEASTRLAAGQEIRIPPLPEGPGPDKPTHRPVNERDAKEMQRLVLYQDASVIVLDKPAGLAVQGGPGITRSVDGLLGAFQEPGEDRPRLVHRLDKDTSGVLVIARTPAAAAQLAAAFRGRGITKTYWALVAGEPEIREGRIDLALAKLDGPRGDRVQAVDDPRQGSRAITDFRTMDRSKGRATWLEMNPLTGRTHQLRVHCAEALGCAIVGDFKYGGEEVVVDQLAHALHLHARALDLPHPEGGRLQVAAPLPPHMKASFDTLGFEPPRTPKPKRVAG